MHGINAKSDRLFCYFLSNPCGKSRDNGLTASELALDSGSEETPEHRFVRSKRSPIGAKASTSKQSQTTGPKLVAESISKAVDWVTRMEDKNDSDRVAIAKIKSEQHPMRQEAMAIFNKGCRKNLKPQHIIVDANKLKKRWYTLIFLPHGWRLWLELVEEWSQDIGSVWRCTWTYSVIATVVISAQVLFIFILFYLSILLCHLILCILQIKNESFHMYLKKLSAYDMK